jgi:hypothetical protein
MARIEEPRRNVFRLMGRGREETAPVYLQLGVIATVSIVVGLIVGLVFLAYELAK